MTEPQKVHVAESAHWYDKATGQPVYQVDGHDTTMRDARKLLLLTGVTSILRCGYAYKLEKWKIEQGIKSSARLPRLPDEPEDVWLDRVFKDSGEIAKAAAERGTEIHAAIEKYYSGDKVPIEMGPLVTTVVAKMRETFGGPRWITEKSVSCRKGYGTKADLSCDQWVIDFKGYADKAVETLNTYENHWMQLAATRHALQDFALRHSEPVLYTTSRCAIVYVHRDTGETTPIEVPEPKLEQGLAMFDALLTYWKAWKKYDPSW